MCMNYVINFEDINNFINFEDINKFILKRDMQVIITYQRHYIRGLVWIEKVGAGFMFYLLIFLF